MATNARTTAGTTLSVSAALPATEDAAGYALLSYTVVGEVTDVGDFGKTYNIVNHNPLNTRKTEKLKGNYNNGQLALQLAFVEDDAGQVILRNYLDLDTDLSIKITHQDGHIDYMYGQVTAAPKSVQSEAILSGNVTIEVNSDIVTVAAP